MRPLVGLEDDWKTDGHAGIARGRGGKAKACQQLMAVCELVWPNGRSLQLNPDSKITLGREHAACSEGAAVAIGVTLDVLDMVTLWMYSFRRQFLGFRGSASLLYHVETRTPLHYPLLGNCIVLAGIKMGNLAQIAMKIALHQLTWKPSRCTCSIKNQMPAPLVWVKSCDKSIICYSPV